MQAPPISETAICPPAGNPRERILATAARLFYRDGIRATGIDLIIAEAKVAKASFYGYFPSKTDLVRAFLAARHEQWMGWFRGAVEARLAAEGLGAVASALLEWFARPDFRGCAFINTVAEFGDAFAETSGHKAELRDFLAEVAGRLGLSEPRRVADEAMIVVEGAIIRAQMGAGDGLDAALRSLLSRLALDFASPVR